MGVRVCQVLCPEGQYDELATLLWGHHEDALVRILTQVSGDDVHMDDGWMDGWMDVSVSVSVYVYVCVCVMCGSYGSSRGSLAIMWLAMQ